MKLYIGIIILRFSAASTCSSFISVTHLANGAKCLNSTIVSALPPLAVLFLLIRTYAPE